jgi:thiol-disulfide isomerase/thioredoxin
MRWALLLTAPLLILAACAPGPEGPAAAPAAPTPFGACTDLTAPPASGSSAAPGASGGSSPAKALPDLTLDCYAGGPLVRLADLRGPALVNVWNTGCAPCREEMPALQRLADRTAGKLRVVGVVTGDSRAAASSFGTDTGVDYPNLDDPRQQVMAALGRIAIPLTVLVDGSGSIAYVYNGPALTDATLAELVDTRLGVAVAA